MCVCECVCERVRERVRAPPQALAALLHARRCVCVCERVGVCRACCCPPPPSLTPPPPPAPLAAWLEERVESVYRLHPGYNDKATTLFTLDLGSPQDLPDAMRGEKWSFVQLPLGALQEVG